MLAKNIKEKLRDGKVSIGSWMSMGHASIAEILVMAGFDWVVIETEHTAIDVSEVLRLIIAIQQRGGTPLVRLAGIDPVQAKAVLDSGAAGVIVPMVNTKADAELAVAMCKYPPQGTRGVGLARAQGYGQDFDNYVRTANDNTLVIVQIEHIDAVNNIDAILSVPGIDGTFIGPYDLSMSLGVPGQLSHSSVVATKEKVLKAVLQKKLAAGIHYVQPSTAAADCAAGIAEGYTFVAVGTDILFLGDSARQLQQAVFKNIR
ncbi:MAG: hypothetical protein JO301_15170 [Chitinophagaceae bacterium]|nr:hypothetical protein [Chitinophagaceae bacterium]